MFGFGGGGFMGGGQGGGGFFVGPPGGRFDMQYRVYPVSFINKEDLEKGNRIILPPSALDHLARLNITYPMLFEVTNPKTQQRTHCGVLEFIAEEGTCFLPLWMMCNLGLGGGEFVRILNTTLQKGTYVKLQPVTRDFLDIHNPKAVLENTLSSYACLTVGDLISFHYNNHKYEIEIVETKPSNAVSIIETDVNVDFAPPKDYNEPQLPNPMPDLPLKKDEPDTSPPDSDAEGKFQLFQCRGTRLDGKEIKDSPSKKAREIEEEEDLTPWLKARKGGVRTETPFGIAGTHMTGQRIGEQTTPPEIIPILFSGAGETLE